MRPRRKFSACAQSRCPQSRYAPPPVCNALLPYRVFSQDNPSTASQLPDRMWPDSARCNLCKLVYTSDPQAHRAFPRGHSSGVVRITVICPGGAARHPVASMGRGDLLLLEYGQSSPFVFSAILLPIAVSAGTQTPMTKRACSVSGGHRAATAIEDASTQVKYRREEMP